MASRWCKGIRKVFRSAGARIPVRALRLGSIVMLGASNEIIAKGTRIASHVLEVAVADLEFISGRFIVTGTDRSIGIFDVAAAAVQRNDLPDELRSLDGIGDETVNLAAFPYGCHVCEVEVDPDTGVVRDRALRRGR